MTRRVRRIAIVCQPWDDVAPQSSSSIPIIAYQVAQRFAREWYVTIYGRRGPRQARREMDGETIEFKRFMVLQKPQALVEVLLGILACYRKTCFPYVFSYIYHLFFALRVAVSIRVSKDDIVYVHNFIQFASIIKFFNPSAKICLHMHCEWLTDFATAATERRLRGVDLIIGVSDYITERIRSRFPDIAGRCHTVYNGVDTNLFCPAPNVPTQSDRAERLLYVGRLSSEKGVHILIRAFKILTDSRPMLLLDLIGAADAPKYLYSCPDLQDPAIASLQPFYGDTLFDMVRRQLILRGGSYLGDLATEAADDDRIVFHGGVSHPDTIAFYRRATMLVLASVWNEPSPLPTYEAAACGLPVVSTHSGGIPEIVEQRRTGILVARGEAGELALAIAQVLDNPHLARSMGEAGRQRAIERFSWDVVSRRFADLIEGLFPVHGSPSSRLARATPEGSASRVKQDN
jgi:glycosyltransferase involved in cell wall biosynthesis